MVQKPVILGIDPGTTRIGYGIVRRNGNGVEPLGYGLIEPTRSSPGVELGEVANEISKIIKRFEPSVAGVEKLFFSRNKTSAIAVAQARGVIIATLAAHGVRVVELSPGEVKAGVTGYGNASKNAVEKMVRKMLALGDERIIDDTIDALAIAVTASYGEKMRIDI